MKIKHGLVVFVSGLLLAALLASWLLRPRDMAQLGLDSQTPILSGRAQCDAARGPCEFRAGPLLARLTLVPPVQPLNPFSMDLYLEGLSPRQAVVTFTMVDMEMGLNRFALRPGEGGRWYGQAMLPVCSQGRKDWLATLTVGTTAGDYRIVFPFTTQ